MNPNELADMSYWFPILKETEVKVPNTTMIASGITMKEYMGMLDDVKPEAWDRFVADMTRAIEEMGGELEAVFIRTGQGSGKHEWNRTCYYDGSRSIEAHLYALIEWSFLVDMVGLRCTTWAVREMLPTSAPFTAFTGKMPVTRERRIFIEDGKVVCNHPYWPKDAIRDPDEDNWEMTLNALNHIEDVTVGYLEEQSEHVSRAFEGAWSLDWLETDRGWYAIDMAPAVLSYHWPRCPTNRWNAGRFDQ